MGKRAISLVQLDVDKVIQLLNKALADEWLAYYQYWMGAKLAQGRMRPIVVKEFEEHAGEELEHANKIVERILQLGGTPLLDPQNWFTQANCKYDSPENPNTKILIEQNIKAERCAIDVYSELVKITKNKDELTYQLALEILHDEIKHEDELEAIVEDMGVKS